MPNPIRTERLHLRPSPRALTALRLAGVALAVLLARPAEAQEPEPPAPVPEPPAMEPAPVPTEAPAEPEPAEAAPKPAAAPETPVAAETAPMPKSPDDIPAEPERAPGEETIEDAAEEKKGFNPKFTIGTGLRTGLNFIMAGSDIDDPQLTLSDGLVDQVNIRPFMAGALTENIGFFVQFEIGTPNGLGPFAILDGMAQIKFIDELQLWVGQHIPANDRNNAHECWRCLPWICRSQA